jgi:hypothetical protein
VFLKKKKKTEIFQRTMEKILNGINGIFIYIDDVLIYGKNELEHDSRLKEVKKVKERLSHYGVMLNDRKCKIKCTSIKFLAHQITKDGVRPCEDKLELIKNFRIPENLEEVRSFLGLTNYVSKFIPDVATKTNLLRELIKNGKYNWNEEINKSFTELKNALDEKVLLGYYSFNDDITVVADASNTGLGGVLIQTNAAGPRIIAFGHRSLSEREQKFHITEKEAMALVWAVEHFHRYLFGRKFDLITDH